MINFLVTLLGVYVACTFVRTLVDILRLHNDVVRDQSFKEIVAPMVQGVLDTLTRTAKESSHVEVSSSDEEISSTPDRMQTLAR